MIKIEHNVETNEILEISLTEKEVKEIEKIQEEHQILLSEKAAEQAAKAQARQALLDKLGITEDEAKLLLGGN